MQSWGESADESIPALKSNFLDLLDKVTNSMSSAKAIMASDISLTEMDCCAALEKMTSPADYIAASQFRSLTPYTTLTHSFI